MVNVGKYTSPMDPMGYEGPAFVVCVAVRASFPGFSENIRNCLKIAIRINSILFPLIALSTKNN